MMRPRAVLAAVALMAAAIACAVRGAGWWPCDIACQGGGWYRDLFGIPTVLPAAAAYALVAALAALAARRRSWPGGAVLLTWGLAGASAFYLEIAWQLGLRCPFCFTVHALVGLALAMTWPWPAALPRRWPPLVAAGAFLALNFAYHHAAVPDVVIPPPPAPAGSAPSATAAESLERARSLGDPAAPLAVTIAIEMHCPVCARLHPRLGEALHPALASRRARLVTRFLVRRRQPSGGELAAHVLAAGADDPQRGRAVLGALLGVRDGTGFAAAAPLLEGVADPAAIAAARTTRAAAIDALLADDARWLASHGVRKVPTVVIEGPDGAVRGRWEGELEPTAVAEALAAP